MPVLGYLENKVDIKGTKEMFLHKGVISAVREKHRYTRKCVRSGMSYSLCACSHHLSSDWYPLHSEIPGAVSVAFFSYSGTDIFRTRRVKDAASHHF